HPPDQEDPADAAPVEAVRDPARHEHEEDGGEELRQAEQTDVELVAGDVEHLLVEHRDEHVQTDRGERRRHQVTAHARVPQDVTGAGHGGSVSVPRRSVSTTRDHVTHVTVGWRSARHSRTSGNFASIDPGEPGTHAPWKTGGTPGKLRSSWRSC